MVSPVAYIWIDRTRCVGNGECVVTAPALFTQDDAGVASPIRQPRTGAEVAIALLAVDRCPSGAIALTDLPDVTDDPRVARRDDVRKNCDE